MTVQVQALKCRHSCQAKARLTRMVRRRHRPVIGEFQSDAVEIEERTPPRVARTALYTCRGADCRCGDMGIAFHGRQIVTAPGKLIRPSRISSSSRWRPRLFAKFTSRSETSSIVARRWRRSIRPSRKPMSNSFGRGSRH